MTARSKQPGAATGLRRKMKVDDLITAGRAIVAAGRNNPALPKRFPGLDRLEKAVLALESAQVAALSRTAGTVAARDAAAGRVFVALAQYKGAVQKVADADPLNAASIIIHSGLRTRRESTRRKALFSVKRGRASCSLDAEVKAVTKRASYEWEISLDAGQTWIPVRATLQTKTTIRDLPLGALVQVRCRPVTKSGQGEWIGPVSVRVT
jgi:hypothetical protein